MSYSLIEIIIPKIPKYFVQLVYIQTLLLNRYKKLHVIQT